MNFLLLDVFQVDLKTAPEDEIDEDFMMAIKPNQVHIYCNPSNYGKLIDRYEKGKGKKTREERQN